MLYFYLVPLPPIETVVLLSTSNSILVLWDPPLNLTTNISWFPSIVYSVTVYLEEGGTLLIQQSGLLEASYTFSKENAENHPKDCYCFIISQQYNLSTADLGQPSAPQCTSFSDRSVTCKWVSNV